MKIQKSQAEARAKEPAYVPTSLEEKAVDALKQNQAARPPAPRMKVLRLDGKIVLEPDHPSLGVGTVLVMESVGTTNADFAHGLIGQLLNAGTQGKKADESALNFMLSMVRGVEPRDQVEAMLAAQMATIHNATMTFARRLAHVENIPQQDSAERALNKLARTFAAQVEALKRYRSKGEQTVRVERVTINEGGQAIVGNVRHGGEGAQTKLEPTS